MLTMALARTRQLAAHETGHTLGLAHNFAASAFPHVAHRIGLRDGLPASLDNARQEWRPGSFLSLRIEYRDLGQGHHQLRLPPIFRQPPNERFELDAILSDATKSGLVYITDEDARPAGRRTSVCASLGQRPGCGRRTDPHHEDSRGGLEPVRRERHSDGRALAQLEDTLAPLYLMHRYQTEAAIKEIGGLDYRYQLRGDGNMNAAIVAADEQSKALHAVVKTLSPDTLTLPESLLKLLPPRPPGYARTAESLPARTGLTFDPIAAAESAADLTLATLFNAERAARIVEYSARMPGAPRFEEVIEAALAASRPSRTAGKSVERGLEGQVQAAIYARTVEAVLTLAADPKAAVAVRAITNAKLDEIKRHADSSSPLEAYLNQRIQEFQRDPKEFIVAVPVMAPPGMPIGDEP